MRQLIATALSPPPLTPPSPRKPVDVVPVLHKHNVGSVYDEYFDGGEKVDVVSSSVLSVDRIVVIVFFVGGKAVHFER